MKIDMPGMVAYECEWGECRRLSTELDMDMLRRGLVVGLPKIEEPGRYCIEHEWAFQDRNKDVKR